MATGVWERTDDRPWRRTVRWGATHGAVRAILRGRARAGNLDAHLLLDPELQARPYEQYERLRTAEPFTEGAFFARLSVHHEVCDAVLRSDDFGVADRDGAFPAPLRLALRLAGPSPQIGPIDPPSMLAVDDPDHARYRRLVNRAFTAKSVAVLRERTERIAHELLDDLAGDARAGVPVDVVARYASLLPVTVISEMLGVPAERRDDFLAWGDGAAAALDIGLDRRTHAEVEANLAALNAWMRGHIAALRAAPGDDLVSRLVTVADDDGRRLTDEEVGATAGLLLGAGFETTANLVSSGVGLLIDHPDQRARLAGDPGLWPGAVEEILRFESPVQRTARRARRDTQVHGVDVAAGDLVVTVLGGANRDPRVFADPHRFDVARPNAREHLAFSGGVHFCLGAALARMEGEIALRALFERFADLAPVGTPRRRSTRILRGWSTLPVVLGSPQ